MGSQEKFKARGNILKFFRLPSTFTCKLQSIDDDNSERGSPPERQEPRVIENETFNLERG